jgi:hypothetical protein
VVAPLGSGPQPFGTGGEMELWESRNEGRTWRKVRDLTKGSARNHSYARKPLNAHPDFYALWADGNAHEASGSMIYFTNKAGDVFMLPGKMDAPRMRPQRVK